MFEELETGNPEVPLYFGEGLRRSLGNAAGCGEGGQMGCVNHLLKLHLYILVDCFIFTHEKIFLELSFKTSKTFLSQG